MSGKSSSGTGFICEKTSYAASEAYKRLRQSAFFALENAEHCVIGVTSSQPSDGKSITSVNFAYAVAQAEKKVILVDCDLRRSSIHEKMGMNQSPGLADILNGRNDIGAICQKYVPSTEGALSFDVLTGGDYPANPSELLGSSRMVKLIETLKKAYDYVVLDLPPVLAVVDAQTCTSLTDGMILVVRENHCTTQIISDSVGLLQQAKANILGFVLNGSTEGAGKGYGYGKYYGGKYGGYYSHYYAPKQGEEH